MERGKKVVFDDDGEAHDPHKLASLTEFTPVDLEKMKEEHRSATITGMKNVDKVDKEEERVKRKLKKQEKKHKERALRRIEVIFALTKSGPVTGVTLASPEATASASEYESDHSVEQEKPSKKLKTLEHMNTQSLQDLALQLLDE